LRFWNDKEKMTRNDETAGLSPTHTRACERGDAADNGGAALHKLLRDNPQLFNELYCAGLRITYHRKDYRAVSFRLVTPSWTDDQRRIQSLLSHPTLWTAHDLARALGKDAINSRVLGKIGKDCATIHAHERSVARLWNGQRLRVYSFTTLDDLPLAQIRAQYRVDRGARHFDRKSRRTAS
jgi:hypothetical protein